MNDDYDVDNDDSLDDDQNWTNEWTKCIYWVTVWSPFEIENEEDEKKNQIFFFYFNQINWFNCVTKANPKS